MPSKTVTDVVTFVSPDQALEDLSEERRSAWGEWLDGLRAAHRAEGRPEAARRADQDDVNPCYVPRNQLMQVAIARAEAGDYDEVRTPPVASAHAPTFLTSSGLINSALPESCPFRNLAQTATVGAEGAEAIRITRSSAFSRACCAQSSV